MNPIATQVYSGMWIRLPVEVKGRIAEIFEIPKNGSTHVSDNQVIADGYLDRDLARLNVESLQKHLKSDNTDLFQLWNNLVYQVTEELKPKPVHKEEEKPRTEVNITIDGDNVKVAEKRVGRPKKND